MSSGQWEVVGKNKKDRNVQNGKTKNKDKAGAKIEDVLTNIQIKSFYAGVEVDGNKKLGKENNKKKLETTKKPNQKTQEQKEKEKSEPPKPKPPKTIETALQAIDVNELATLITSNKLRFSNAPLVWLKELAAFLNSKLQIDVEDPTFPHQPANYPLNVVPEDLRKLLKTVLEDAGKSNLQLFFDVTLTTVANDMSRGQSVNGHRLLLQILGYEHPEFCVESILKSSNLRNSYQNRPPIGLTLLWAFGQGGYHDFTVGLKAWQELFLPIIELKNYSKYIVLYLTKLLDKHLKMDSAKLSQEQFFSLFDSINTKRNSLPKDLSSDLLSQLVKLKDLYLKSASNKLQVTFNTLMKKLPNQFIESNNLDPFQKLHVGLLVDCLERDDSCNATWRQLFLRCSKQSATLLSYIHKNWDQITSRFKVNSLKVTVTQYKEVCGDALKGKKKDEAVVKANKICQDLLDKMASKSKKGFPWLWASFFLLISISGLIAFDVTRAGGDFPKSTTGQILKDFGILEQTQQAWQKSLSTSARGYLWLESNVPIYYHHTANFSKPYLELARDLAIVGTNHAITLYGNVKEYVVEKAPVVQAKVDEFAPGLVDNVVQFSAKGWESTRKFAIDWYSYSSDVLKEKVFVGEYSPEKLQIKTETALNATRNHVSTYLVWLRQQIHVYSEIP